MKIGFSRVCINPPYGAPIVGYYESRHTKGIADDIFVRAVAFDDGKEKALVVAIDVCVLEQKYYDEFKKEIVKAIGLNHNAIFINCSHTHTGPLVGKDFALDIESSKTYDDFLISCVRDAAVYAFGDACEAQIEMGEGYAKNISFIRRFRMKDGSVATNPGVRNPNIDYPLGTPNETVKLVKIIRQNADDIFIVNFGTHPDSVGGEYISADYMGYVCSILENAVPNTKCIFLLGPQGDVNHVNVNPTDGESAISEIDFDGVPRSLKLAEHMGRVIAGAVLSICSITEKVKTDTISYASAKAQLPTHQENHRLSEARKICEYYYAGRTDELPYKEMELTTAVAEAKRIVDLENGPESLEFYLSALKIGELVFAGIGGEPFTEVGNSICKNSPYKNMVLCCLTNSAGEYIPNREAYNEGGYEAKTSRISPGGDAVLVEAMAEVLKTL